MQTGTVQPDQPKKLTKEQAQQTAFWTMLVALIGVLFIVALVGVMLHRRRLRDRRIAAERKERESEHGKPRVDAWEEAGRRAAVPPPGELPTAEAKPLPPEERNQSRPLAVITGAARRVGRATALELARCGCDIIFTYNASEEDAHALAKELADAGASVSFYQLDLDDLPAVEAFGTERAEMLSHVDILVHNASMYEPSPLSELSAESLLKQYRINAAAPLLLTARLAPLLRQSKLNGGASVIAMADIHAMGRPRRDFAAYSMSKAALIDMVYGLARDLAPHVRVNAVAPGVVAWPEEGDDADPDSQAKYLRRIPLGRAGSPDDAARAVRWLCLEATYVTGEIIRVDGGRWLT
ncbi:putative oxidoreductase YohF [Phycisphaerales bacterium]|nr:putative oxidoreductase YohF [Phycisphaerales bacterium]